MCVIGVCELFRLCQVLLFSQLFILGFKVRQMSLCSDGGLMLFWCCTDAGLMRCENNSNVVLMLSYAVMRLSCAVMLLY